MRDDRGFVLVIVLWVLAALTVLTIGFSRRASLEMRASAYGLDHAQAMMMARGAVNRGIVELQNKSLKDMLSETDQMTYLGQPWAQPTNLLAEGTYFDVPPGEFANDVVQFKIVDAESLINVNRAPEALLEEVEGIGRRIARKIVTRREEGEDGEGPSAFQAIEEIRFLEGFDDDDWFGTEKEPGLKDILTTHGDGHINVNTASKAVLNCIPELDDGAIAQILAYRAGGDGKPGTPDDQGFRSIEEVGSVAGVRGDGMQALQQFCTVDSGVFMIQGIATRRGGKIRASVTAVAVAGSSVARLLSWREDALGA
ncbi:MAG: general secretion pathway protein GspK [Candidatus Hydrogenedentes bacterium]|nr:general secretion pathway protein GspK [Candidatus Hydrogenedentota bacterium]